MQRSTQQKTVDLVFSHFPASGFLSKCRFNVFDLVKLLRVTAVNFQFDMSSSMLLGMHWVLFSTQWSLEIGAKTDTCFALFCKMVWAFELLLSNCVSFKTFCSGSVSYCKLLYTHESKWRHTLMATVASTAMSQSASWGSSNQCLPPPYSSGQQLCIGRGNLRPDIPPWTEGAGMRWI